ncbi:MAG: ECF transporter S component [Pyrinomonadaceae bacterium]
MKQTDAMTFSSNVLPALETKAIIIQMVLLASAAFVLPAAAHMVGLPTRVLLPMHWPVIMAGLCYGWRSGAVIGLLAPVTSFLISGMPPALMLPAMTVELAAYGLLAGLARQNLRYGWFASSAVSLIGGRIVFLAVALLLGTIAIPFGDYLASAMLPGIPAAIAQLIILSLAAGLWVGPARDEQRTAAELP